MKLNISPLDVRNQIFKKSFRGYDPEEVKYFLDSVADSIEGLLKEKEELEKEVVALRQRIQVFTEMETTLRDAMVTAQKVSDQAKANAEQEARSIIHRAELQAEQHLSEARRSVEAVEKTRNQAVRETLALITQLRSLFESHLTFLCSLEDEVRKERGVEGKEIAICEGSQS